MCVWTRDNKTRMTLASRPDHMRWCASIACCGALPPHGVVRLHRMPARAPSSIYSYVSAVYLCLCVFVFSGRVPHSITDVCLRCMYVCVCVRLRVCVCARVCVYACVAEGRIVITVMCLRYRPDSHSPTVMTRKHIYKHPHTHAHTRTHTHTHTCTRTHIHTGIARTRPHPLPSHTHTHTHMYAHTHTHAHTYADTNTHTYIHKGTRTHRGIVATCLSRL